MGASVITRGPSLTEQVRQHIKTLITEGGFDDGRIPPETELASDLGVSRTTVRDALSRLEHEGVVVRRQGAGTFVNTAGLRIKTRLEEMWSYEEMLRDHGFTPRVEVISVSREPAGSELAELLRIAAADEVVAMEKVFYEDDDPVVITTNRVAANLITHDLTDADAAAPVFELFERAGLQLTHYVSEIVPHALDEREAGLLDVAPGTPVIAFDETGFTADGTPLVHARSMFRDDLVRLGVMRRRATG
jgi:GntR family transcriptional regulator